MTKFALIFFVTLSPHLFAELSVSALAYDKETDDLVITAQFPGKCLAHDLNLAKTKAKGNKVYFRLDVTNSATDPCNAINEKTARFSLANITERPADILVSTHADGSKPHFIAVPAHPATTIMKVQNQENGSLVFSLRYRGPKEPDRFYLALDCSNAHGGVCEGVVRDKHAYRYAREPLVTKNIVLSPQAIARPQTLSFTYGEKGQAVRILLP